MRRKKEKTQEDIPAAPSVVEKPETPEKVAGPQRGPAETSSGTPETKPTPPLARSADRLTAQDQNLDTAGRGRMVGSMQQGVGNARVGRMLGTGVKRKAEVSAPEDSEEREADQVADKVMRMGDKERAAPPGSRAGGTQEPSGGGGQPVSESDRNFMEPRIGRSFENVRLHTDPEANREATEVGAKAFTQGSDISFGPGSGPEDKQLLAHELTHVAQQGNGGGPGQEGVARQPSATGVMRAPGPLTAAQEASARSFNKSHFDERSIRIIQIITGTGVDGRFGDVSAQAVATFQIAHGLAGVDGKVGPATLNEMVLDRALAGRHEHAIQLVVNFHNLNVSSDTLSIQFQPEGLIDFLGNLLSGAPVATTTFGPGNLRVIRVGPRAFFSEAALTAAISAELTAPAPAVAPVGPRPTLLTGAQEGSATSFNRSHFNDRRSVLGIQGHVGANPDGRFGADTAERIADAQRIAGLTVDGKVGGATLELFVTQLAAAGQQDTAIRMIVDFFNLSEHNNLLAIFFDPTVTTNASTDARPNEPVRVRIGPSIFARAFPDIVHTIAHELEHVRQHRIGIPSQNTREFLGEAIEILSVGMPEEALETVAPGGAGFVAGFASDARRGLNRWNLMPLADRQQFRLRFIAVRQKVRDRVAAGTAAQQALHAPLVAAYNATVVPP